MEYIKPIKIGNLKINNNVFLAPIAGYTDMPFRHICKLAGAGLTFTEMVSAKGLFFSSQNSYNLLKISKSEDVKGVQIFGSDPDIMAKIVAETLQVFDIIDINMGCPVSKIVKNGEGSALLNDLSLSYKIIKACADASKKPITVKFRRGFETGNDISADFGKMCEQAGAKMLTLHGRFAKQFYSGVADYDCIEKLVKAVKIPVAANGDIDSIEKTKEVFKITGCAAVMIARAAIGNPGIFSEILERKAPDKKELLLKQLQLMNGNYDEKYAVTNIRKFVPHYFKSYKNAKKIKEKINDCINFIELYKTVEEIDF